MIPLLYEKGTVSFPDSTSSRLGGAGCLGGLPDCISCDVREVLNGEYECVFQYPCNAPMYPEIKIGRIVLVIHDPSLETEPFDIHAVRIDTDGIATFTAHHVSYRLAKRTVLPYGYYNESSSIALATILGYINPSNSSSSSSYRNGINALPDGSNFNPSFYPTNDLQYVQLIWRSRPPVTTRSAILDGEESIVAQTGFEMKWRVYNFVFCRRRGEDKPVVVRFGHNIKDLSYEYDRSDAGNEIIPYFTYNHEEEDGSKTLQYMLDGDPNATGGGRLVPITIAYGFHSSPPTFSGTYISFPSKRAVHGTYNAIPVDISSYMNTANTEPTVEGFIKAAEQYCIDNAVGLPYENLTVEFEPEYHKDSYGNPEYENLVLGDSAIVLYPEIGVNKRMRLVSATYNVLLERYKQMEFGVASQSIYTVKINMGTSQISGTDIVTVDGLPSIDEIPLPDNE